MVAAEWWGASAAQDVCGDLEVEAGALAFFSVVRSDGTQVMLARGARQPGRGLMNPARY
jgi:hypothetical protein